MGSTCFEPVGEAANNAKTLSGLARRGFEKRGCCSATARALSRRANEDGAEPIELEGATSVHATHGLADSLAAVKCEAARRY